MAISSDTRRSGPFIGTGKETVFPFSFKINSADHVKVVVSTDGGVTEEALSPSAFSVSLNSDQDNQPGGSVTLVDPLASESRLSVISDAPYLQPMVLTNRGGFYPETLNDSADSIVIQIQQLKEQLNRAVKVSATSTDTPEDLAKDLYDARDRAEAADKNAAASASAAANSAATTESYTKNVLAIKDKLVTVSDNIEAVKIDAANIGAIKHVSDNMPAVIDAPIQAAAARNYAEQASAIAGGQTLMMPGAYTALNLREWIFRKAQVFNSVAEMKASGALGEGMAAMTLGYYEPGDGGMAFYRARTMTSDDVDDGGSIHTLPYGMCAELLDISQSGYIDLRWFGARQSIGADRIDCSDVFKRVIEYSNEHYLKPIKLIGRYYVDKTIEFTGSLHVVGIDAPAYRFFSDADASVRDLQANSEIIVNRNISCFKMYGVGNSDGRPGTSYIYVRNVVSHPDGTGIASACSFIDYNSMGAPTRPSLITENQLYNFGAVFTCTDPADKRTMLYNLDFSRNHIYSCNYIFNIDTGVETLGGLNVHDNVIEWCNNLTINNLFGCNFFTNNLMEGSHGTYEITCSSGYIKLEGNYFEGSRIDFNISSYYEQTTHVSILPQYTTPQGTEITFNFSKVILDDFVCNDLKRRETDASGSVIYPGTDNVSIGSFQKGTVSGVASIQSKKITFGIPVRNMKLTNVNAFLSTKSMRTKDSESVGVYLKPSVSSVKTGRITAYPLNESQMRLEFDLGKTSVVGTSGDYVAFAFYKTQGAINAYTVLEGNGTKAVISVEARGYGVYVILQKLTADMPYGKIVIEKSTVENVYPETKVSAIQFINLGQSPDFDSLAIDDYVTILE